MSKPTACLVDAHNYIFRAYHGLPPMQSREGVPTAATFGFGRTLLRVLREQKPEYVAALFETRASFRRELFQDYKANRKETPDDLIPQFETSRRMAKALGFPCFELEGFEADDLIGTFAWALADRGVRVVMVSGDKDLAQLVRDDVTLLDIAKNRHLDAGGVEDRFGVRPDQIADLLALAGDSVDNIPGIPGVGPKTASAILQELGDIDTLVSDPERLDDVPIRGRASLKSRLKELVEQLELSRQLATIRCDAPMAVDPDSLRYQGAVPAEIDALFAELGFGARLRDEIPRWQDGGGHPAPAPSSRRRPIVETGRLPL